MAEKNKESSHAVLITESELAVYLSIAEGRIRKLVSDGHLKRAERGKYNKDECLTAYIKYQATLLQSRRKTNEKIEATAEDYNKERARLTKAQADKHEFDLSVKQGEYVEISQLKNVLSKIITNCRNKLLAIPKKTALEVCGIKKPAEVEELIKKVIYEVLDELVTPDFEDFEDDENMPEDQECYTTSISIMGKPS